MVVGGKLCKMKNWNSHQTSVYGMLSVVTEEAKSSLSSFKSKLKRHLFPSA